MVGLSGRLAEIDPYQMAQQVGRISRFSSIHISFRRVTSEDDEFSMQTQFVIILDTLTMKKIHIYYIIISDETKDPFPAPFWDGRKS